MDRGLGIVIKMGKMNFIYRQFLALGRRMDVFTKPIDSLNIEDMIEIYQETLETARLRASGELCEKTLQSNADFVGRMMEMYELNFCNIAQRPGVEQDPRFERLKQLREDVVRVLAEQGVVEEGDYLDQRVRMH